MSLNFNQILVKMKENPYEVHENKANKSTPIAKVAPEKKQSADFDTEITKICAVLGCEDSKNLDPESFFRFPEDPSQRQIWTDLTGRNNWTPTDFSYICIQHFSVDSFKCDEDSVLMLEDNAVPSLKLPRHVLEVEYIDDDTFDNDDDNDNDDGDRMDTDDEETTEAKTKKPETNGLDTPKTTPPEDKVALLKLFTEVQRLQRQAVGTKDKLKYNMRMHNRQTRQLQRLNQLIEIKKGILNQKRKKKSRILLSLQDKIHEDTSGLLLAMPTKHTEDLKNFALSIYKHSPQSYIYIRNALRTMLPSTEVLDSWLNGGFQPKNVLKNGNLIKIVSEQTDGELSCKITLA